ncbi:MAG: tRNA-dihydrouridine synthase [Candidatus Lokiarchaeota archaeon]|nr:tRNA-dihydrouridine synthase [Candidatus Lokiarchaeota archaeon]
MELHLAPMKNISCWAFRALFPEITDSYTEMINLKELIKERQRVWDHIDTFQIKNHRQWIQVLTNNVNDMLRLPECLKSFYSKNPERANIYGVCINACCPDPRIISAGEGAALVKRTKRLRNLIEVFLGDSESHRFHISCKMLLGLNSKEMYYNKCLDFLSSIESIDDPRLAPTIIHFKHAKQPSISEPHWEFLQTSLKAGMPIIINGNIRTNQDIQNIKQKLSLDTQKKWNELILGLMIGREALRNPDCFQFFITRSQNEKISKKKLLKNNIKTHSPEMRFLKNIKKYIHFE